MKSRLILNPIAGSDTGTNHLPTLNEQLRERVGAMDIVMTVGPDDAAQAAAEAALAATTLSSSPVGWHAESGSQWGSQG